MSTISRLECRRRMHNAERLARLARKGKLSGPIDFLTLPIEEAYMSPECEDTIAQRISAALDLIGC